MFVCSILSLPWGVKQNTPAHLLVSLCYNDNRTRSHYKCSMIQELSKGFPTTVRLWLKEFCRKLSLYFFSSILSYPMILNTVFNCIIDILCQYANSILLSQQIIPEIINFPSSLQSSENYDLYQNNLRKTSCHSTHLNWMLSFSNDLG